MSTITPLPLHEARSIDEAIGLRVRQLLVGRGTQADLAEALHLKQPDVSRRLHGRVSWRASEVVTVAHLLGVPVAALYGEGPADDDVSGALYALRARRDSNPQPSDLESPTALPSAAAGMFIIAGLVMAARAKIAAGGPR